MLYFEDLSRDSSLAHAADGLTEGLIRELSRVRGLDVISSPGVAHYRASTLSRDSIARALQTGSLIVGSVEPADTLLRITARLVDGNTGVDVERATFSLPINQVVSALDSLGREVARLLRPRLGEEVKLQERRARTANVEAWTHVQLAERLRKQSDALLASDNRAGAIQALVKADSMLRHAQSADDNWLEPFMLRGWVAYRRSQFERGAGALALLDTALAHVGRMLGRAPDEAEALALRGTVRYRQWQLRVSTDRATLDSLLQRARVDLETSVQADPTLARANLVLSNLYYQIRDLPGAALAARRAYEEDAYLERADRTLDRLFKISLDLESFPEARRWCAEGARRFPNEARFIECQLSLMATPAVPQPDAREAGRLLQRLDSVLPASDRILELARARILFGGALARAGLRDSARSVLRTARDGVTAEIDPHQDLLAREAYARTLAKEHDIAIDLLKRYVVANPGHGFAEHAGTVWWWRELVKHPRWREVAQPGR